MKLTIFEGTPEEISKAFPHLMPQMPTGVAHAIAVPLAEEAKDVGHSEGRFVSEAVARRALSRIDLAPSQLVMLKLLYNAGGKYLFSPDLMAAVKLDRHQFTGFMGAFGRRVSSTPGYREGTKILDRVWDYEVGTNKYRLPETVRKAMELEKLV